MNRKSILAGVAATALIAAVPGVVAPEWSGLNPVSTAKAEARLQVSISFFYDELQDHGRWVRHGPHGYVWIPTDVDRDWQPYTDGHWIYTRQYGWYFVSDEPYAWAVYHYGRWGYDVEIGWFWVPGTEWAPAWVAWRRGGDHLGWAPLPPRHRDRGTSVSVSIDVRPAEIPAFYWAFVPVLEFLSPSLETVVVEPSRRTQIFQNTQFLGPVHVEGDLIVNNIVEINYIEQHVDQTVNVYDVQTVDEPQEATVAQVEGEAIPVFQPTVSEAEQAQPPQAVTVEEARAEAATAGQVSAEEVQAAEQAAAEQPGESAEAAEEAQPGDEAEQPEQAAGEQPEEAAEASEEAQPGAAAEEAAEAGEQTQPEQPEEAAEAGEEVRPEQPAEATEQAEQARPEQPKPVTGQAEETTEQPEAATEATSEASEGGAETPPEQAEARPEESPAGEAATAEEALKRKKLLPPVQ